MQCTKGTDICTFLTALWYKHEELVAVGVQITHKEYQYTMLKSLPDDLCHHLSMRLNCLTGLSRGIVGIIVILPVTCIVRMYHLSCLVFPRSYSLTLGQRSSLMYCSSYLYPVCLRAALDGPGPPCLLLCLLFAD